MAEGLSYNTLIRVARDVGLDPDRTMNRVELRKYIYDNGPPDLVEQKVQEALRSGAKRVPPAGPPIAPLPAQPAAAPAPAPTAVPAPTKAKPRAKPKPKIRVREVDPTPRLTEQDIEKMAHQKAKRREQKEEEDTEAPPPKSTTSAKTAKSKATAESGSGFVHPKYQDKNNRWRWADGPNKGKFCKKE